MYAVFLYQCIAVFLEKVYGAVTLADKVVYSEYSAKLYRASGKIGAPLLILELFQALVVYGIDTGWLVLGDRYADCGFAFFPAGDQGGVDTGVEIPFVGVEFFYESDVAAEIIRFELDRLFPRDSWSQVFTGLSEDRRVALWG